ncbi:MAG: deoxyribose-phosphate aldolase [Bacteroidia bacterium]|nr:deoxyribose-phosphate aldolase [Bacteroidia bacterium]MCF8426746.1 deoxyribose-phosphate aldolase [Bacteroidia bacterium]MCF8446715.1 deoxyribose-phosphate aldolase [Bacteroidia bacterium]
MSLAKYIEHTNLKPNSTSEDIIKLCNEAVENGFYGVCVAPYYVQLAKKTLKKNDTKIITVIGFPFGYSTVSSKVEETKKAITAGAHEVDMVINIAAFKSGDIAAVQNDIQAVVTACHLQNKHAKVIIETCYLNEEEIKTICKICADCEADFVKTSSGYGTEGATVENVKLMRKFLPAKTKIKAAGGIKTKEMANELVAAGADRLGTSASLVLIKP